MLEKMKDRAFGKDVYFLGKDSEGTKYWLEAATWDCGWYWGLGYVETYRQNWKPSKARDIGSHQHFYGLFFNKKKNGFVNWKIFFADSVLTDNELWTLLELMKTAYTMRETAEVLGCGGSNYTSNSCANIIKNEEEVKRINEVVIPAIMSEVYKLLTPETK